MSPAPRQPELPIASRRSAQLALAVFGGVLIGLALFRGYGHHVGARPLESSTVRSGRLDLNSADRSELEQLPGVGPERARAIDAHRRSKPFRSVDELLDVHGFGPTTVEKVRPFVQVAPVQLAPLIHGELEPAATFPPEVPTTAPAAPRTAGVNKIQPGEPPINVNTASADELQRLPGIGPATAQNIIAGRPYHTVNELDRARGIGPKTLDKLRPFVVVK